MLLLALRNLLRRPLRSGLTLLGVATGVGVLACLLAFGAGYQRDLQRELNGMGTQLMLVPLGCPYEGAAGVLKGRALDTSLPASALAVVRRDPATACAAPLLLCARPRPDQGRTDMWAGVDDSAPMLKPWWKLTAGSRWFPDGDSVILGAEAAATELRQVGDTLYSPETGRRLTVCGILERSGTSDDSLFFVPLVTAQAMFHLPDRLTAIAVRLRDPTLLPEAAPRLQTIPGAQVATMTEMMGTFLNLIGAVQTLALAVAVLAVVISGLSVFNTMLGSVLERTHELALLRAVGASRLQVFRLLALESLLLTLVATGLGLLLTLGLGQLAAQVISRFVPLASGSGLLLLTGRIVWQCLISGVGIGLLAGLYPAWRASRMRPAQALRLE